MTDETHVRLSTFIQEHVIIAQIRMNRGVLSELLAEAVLSLPKAQGFSSTYGDVNDALIAALELLTEGTPEDAAIRKYIDRKYLRGWVEEGEG